MTTFLHFDNISHNLFSKLEKFYMKLVWIIRKHILNPVTFSPQNRSVYEIMLKNVVEPEKPQTVCCLRVAY